jgi:hypothetical protein
MLTPPPEPKPLGPMWSAKAGVARHAIERNNSDDRMADAYGGLQIAGQWASLN